jgi:hypothetical protein
MAGWVSGREWAIVGVLIVVLTFVIIHALP